MIINVEVQDSSCFGGFVVVGDFLFFFVFFFICLHIRTAKEILKVPQNILNLSAGD